MISEKDNTFTYSLQSLSAVLIVNLSGDLTVHANQTLENLKQEILGTNTAKAIIINFAQVNSLSSEAFLGLTQLQKSIREKQIELRICSMNLQIKEKLGRAGILRSNELAEDSKQAIYSLFQGHKKAS